jgi:hypothetical protein
MASYSVTINEKSALGKGIVAFLQSLPQIVTFEIPKKKEKQESELYYGLKSAFEDVRLMLDGKKKEKSLDEFIEELERERDNELQYKND